MRRFPWGEAMRLGFGVMHLGPAEFWALTPRELAAAAASGRPGRGAPIRPEDFAALMMRFPDGVTDEVKNGRPGL